MYDYRSLQSEASTQAQLQTACMQHLHTANIGLSIHYSAHLPHNTKVSHIIGCSTAAQGNACCRSCLLGQAMPWHLSCTSTTSDVVLYSSPGGAAPSNTSYCATQSVYSQPVLPGECAEIQWLLQRCLKSRTPRPLNSTHSQAKTALETGWKRC
jgi:hypothetical protein